MALLQSTIVYGGLTAESLSALTLTSVTNTLFNVTATSLTSINASFTNLTANNITFISATSVDIITTGGLSAYSISSTNAKFNSLTSNSISSFAITSMYGLYNSITSNSLSSFAITSVSAFINSISSNQIFINAISANTISAVSGWFDSLTTINGNVLLAKNIGNVGINAINPTHKLYINGTMSANNISSNSASINSISANNIKLLIPGSQYNTFNDDTVKLKHVNWYASNNDQWGQGQLFNELWFGGISVDAVRRIGFYLDLPNAGSTDSVGDASSHPTNAKMYIDTVGVTVNGTLSAINITSNSASINSISTNVIRFSDGTTQNTKPINANSFSILPIASGGTNASSFATPNKFLQFDGTRIVNVAYDQNSFLAPNGINYSIGVSSSLGNIVILNFTNGLLSSTAAG